MGNPLPRHGRFYIRLAPVEWPGTLVTFKSNDGSPDSYITQSHVDSIRAVSNGATFFGFGVTGMVAAGIAANLDRMLAPWDLIISGPPGTMHFYATHGPPPLADEWARVEERLAAASTPDWDLDLDLDPESATPLLCAATNHLLDEDRLGEYHLNEAEQHDVFGVLANINADLADIYQDDVMPLQRATLVFGTASLSGWYKDDPDSQEWVDRICDKVNDALDELGY
ncbi:hypothetical protein GCM10009844_00660 [Nocardioides koreensis]|uniref:Uncharacterized protein n=2 Tax=Nocardioides koreensis TaxID=433651 RepID=A0ABP5KTC2_9ACTN